MSKQKLPSLPREQRPIQISLLITILLTGLLLGSFRLSPWPRSPGLSLLIKVLPIPEFFALFGLLLLTGDNRHSRMIRFLVVVYLGILTAWNAGEIIYRWYYREHFFILEDLALLPSLLTMTTRIMWFRTPFGKIITFTAAAGLLTLFGVLIIHTAGRFSGHLTRGKPVKRQTGIILCALALLQALLFPLETPTVLLVKSFFPEEISPPPVSREYSAAFPAGKEKQVQARSAFERSEETERYSYPGIRDGDIHLLIVESYGHTLFTNPVHKKNISPVYIKMSENLSEAGWSSASGFLHSPAYGGRSWLADSTLVTGVRMVNQKVFDEHIHTDIPNLPGQMGAAGYRTVYAAPGTRETPEDWKSYYNYDEYLIDGGMGWNGPSISFGKMSDQYFLDFLGRRYADSGIPLFLVAIMVSSHVPFDRIPEYFEDPEKLGDGSIYFSEGVRKFDNNWLTGNEYPEGYVRSIEYEFKSILGYLEHYVDKNALVVIVGDHQPRNPISENSATYGVPIHFLSRSPEILESLYTEGFTRGFIPGENNPLIPMERFPSLLNEVIRPEGILSGYMP